MLRALVLAVAVWQACSAALPHAANQLSIAEAPRGSGHCGCSLLATDQRQLTFRWALAHDDRTEQQSAFRLRVWTAAGMAVYDSTKVPSSIPSATVTLPLNGSVDLMWNVVWWDSQDQMSPASESSRFHFADPNWDSSVWIGASKMLRVEFTLTNMPSSAVAYIAGLGYYNLFINGKQVDTGAALNGYWTVFNKRVLYDTLDITPYLARGANAIGVLLAAGWRDTDPFPYSNNKGPCDSVFCMLRMVVQDGSGAVLAASSTSWSGSNASAVTYDSVYNGEHYDARLEQTGWNQPFFKPTQPWSPCTSFSNCFTPALEARPFPATAVESVRNPVSINPLPGCPANKLGGIVQENVILNMTCLTGTISSIEFADFGTPTGVCGNFTSGSCTLPSALAAVSGACVGKSSCQINASNTFFGKDPCYGTPKQLAVTGVGCTDATPPAVVVDFGENLSGVTKINVQAPAGTQISLIHAEVLQHPPYGPTNGDIYNGNFRSAQATDIFTTRGSGIETYQPFSTYHGFRYVKVIGFPNLQPSNIAQVHFHTANRLITNFSSSSPVINTIQYGAYRGQASNMMTLPTDCDQRDERLGWMGDADLSSDSFALNFDSGAFVVSHVRSMVNAQDPNSYSIPDVVPFQRYGGDPADPSWSAALPQNLYVRYKIDGDLTPARIYWDAAYNYMQNVANQLSRAGGMSKWNAPYGDWVPASNPKVSGQVTNANAYITNAGQMAELASAMGQSGNATFFSNLQSSLQQQFYSAFHSNNCYDVCNQAAMAIALATGAVPSGDVSALVTRLVTDIVTTQNNHITTGIIGAKALFPVLTQQGQQSVAVSLAEQVTFPSWGYMFHNDLEPATSNVWELWDSPTEGPGMNSRNHHMFSSISAWFVQHVSGLTQVACDGRTAQITLGDNPLSWTKVSRELPCGVVSVDFQRQGGQHCQLLPRGTEGRLDCGAEGGVISEVTFASYGAPEGGCAAGYTALKGCHHEASHATIEALCLGKQACNVTADHAFWTSLAPMPRCHTLDRIGERSRLAVSVKCSAAAVGHAKVTLPVGIEARVTLKSEQKSVGVTLNGVAASPLLSKVGNLTAATVGSVRGTAELTWAL